MPQKKKTNPRQTIVRMKAKYESSNFALSPATTEAVVDGDRSGGVTGET